MTNDSAFLIWSAFFLARSLPVSTVYCGPSRSRSASRTFARSALLVTFTSTTLYTPVSPSISFCATGSVNATTCAPPMESRPPLYPKMPEMVNVCAFGSSVSTLTWSPTLKLPSEASLALRATWPSDVGPVPERSWTSWSSPVQFAPNRGGPDDGITLPLLPMTRTPSANTSPVALRTPGTDAMVSSWDAAIGAGAVAPSFEATFGFAATWMSV